MPRRTSAAATDPVVRRFIFLLMALAWGLALYHLLAGDAVQAATPALLAVAIVLILRVSR